MKEVLLFLLRLWVMVTAAFGMVAVLLLIIYNIFLSK